jgi:hypothetical protein
MRCIGRKLPQVTAQPSAEGLRAALSQQATARALGAIHGIGIAKGVYRFATHEAAQAQRVDALVRVVAANAARRMRGR